MLFVHILWISILKIIRERKVVESRYILVPKCLFVCFQNKDLISGFLSSEHPDEKNRILQNIIFVYILERYVRKIFGEFLILKPKLKKIRKTSVFMSLKLVIWNKVNKS